MLDFCRNSVKKSLELVVLQFQIVMFRDLSFCNKYLYISNNNAAILRAEILEAVTILGYID